jgi:hypothetical protein
MPAQADLAVTPDLYDPIIHTRSDDLYERYAVMRRKAPVFYSPVRETWCVSRHADNTAAARNWQQLANGEGVTMTPPYMGPGNFLEMDPPRHDYLRDAVRPFFLPKRIAVLEEAVSTRVDELMLAIQHGGKVDVAKEVAWGLPVSVICRLLGAPPADDQIIRGWVETMQTRKSGALGLPVSSLLALDRLKEYITDLVEVKRSSPADDIITALLRDNGSSQPDPEEIVGMLILLFVAGSETAQSLISNAIVLLEARPDVARALRAGPAKLAAENFVEEVLRFDAPVQYLTRVTLEPWEVAGETVPKDARVVLLYGSANRDETRWPDAEAFDPWRDPKRNMAFGEGIHFCLGAPLARLQGRLLFSRFVHVVEDFEIVEKVRTYNHSVRGWGRLIAQW